MRALPSKPPRPSRRNNLLAAAGGRVGVAKLEAHYVLRLERAAGYANRRSFTSRRLSMIRKATAIWHGTGRAGTGTLSTDSGVLKRTPYSYKTRFENEQGTNPEELIAAAHAGCFTMALAFALQMSGFKPSELATEAAVTLEPDGTQGFKISRSALTLRAQIPGISAEKFSAL